MMKMMFIVMMMMMMLFVSIDDLTYQRARRMDVMAAFTQLTPRNQEGQPLGRLIGRTRNLPHHLNPREGWKDSLHGVIDPRIVKG